MRGILVAETIAQQWIHAWNLWVRPPPPGTSSFFVCRGGGGGDMTQLHLLIGVIFVSRVRTMVQMRESINEDVFGL